MKSENELLKLAQEEVNKNGNQSWHSIALTAIEISRKDMFDYLQEQSDLDENQNMSPKDFFEKMERKLIL